MQRSAEQAHFFWHGPPLSVYERTCISSFVKHGFKATVWSFHPVALPSGVHAGDAATILPSAHLTRYTQQGKPANIAAFTDFFRYALLAKEGGWWFDTDVVCLRPASDFTGFTQPLVVGYEDQGRINGAVLRVNAAGLAEELKRRADAIALRGNNSFAWGAVGPLLITDYLRTEGRGMTPEPIERFYPIGCEEADVVLDPDRRNEASRRCSGAHTYHIWNEVLRRCAIPKTLMPPVGSYLHELFVSVDPQLEGGEALPLDTLHALLDHANPKPLGFMVHARELLPSFFSALRKRL